MNQNYIQEITRSVNPDNSYVKVSEEDVPVYGYRIEDIIVDEDPQTVLKILAQLAEISREYKSQSDQDEGSTESIDKGVIVLPSMERKIALAPEVAKLLGIVNPFNSEAPAYITVKGTGYGSHEPSENNLQAKGSRVDGFTGYESEENDIVKALSEPMYVQNPFKGGKQEKFSYITGRLNIVCFPIANLRATYVDENGNEIYKFIKITKEKQVDMPLATGSDRLYVQLDVESCIYTMRDYTDATVLSKNKAQTANSILLSIAKDLSYHPDFDGENLVNRLEEGKTFLATDILLQQIQRRYFEAVYESINGIKLAQRHPQNDSVWGPKDFEESTIKPLDQLTPEVTDLDFSRIVSEKLSGIKTLCQNVILNCLPQEQINAVILEVEEKLDFAISNLNPADLVHKAALARFKEAVANGLRGTTYIEDNDFANMAQSFGYGSSGISNITHPQYSYLKFIDPDPIINNIDPDPIDFKSTMNFQTIMSIINSIFTHNNNLNKVIDPIDPQIINLLHKTVDSIKNNANDPDIKFDLSIKDLDNNQKKKLFSQIYKQILNDKIDKNKFNNNNNI
jgi:hypothetical protein